MFRQSQLLRRTRELVETTEPDARPVVLLADANSTEAGILRALIEKRNFRVVEASEGRSALEIALREPAELVIAALDLPQINGYELCQKLRQHRQQAVPFMLIAPPGIVPDKQIGHETFASDYIQRPVNAAEFEARLGAVLRSNKLAGDSPPAAPAAPVASNWWQSGPRRNPPAPVEPPPAARPPAPEEAPSIDARPGEMEIDELLAEYRRGSSAPPPAAPPAPRQQEPPKPEWPSEAHDALPEMTFEDLANDKLQPQYLVRLAIADDTAALYRQALVFLTVALTRGEMEERLDFGRAVDVARRMVDSLEMSDGLLILATEKTTQYQLSEHCVNVAVFSARIGRTLGMSVEATARVCLAALLHDIGTVRLTRGILHKSAVFTTAERSLLERRPYESAQILSNVPGFEWLPEVVLQVHERDDGSGYPRKLRGRDICEEAKIIGVADSFEGLLHHRPHRRAGTGYRALEILTAQGVQYTDRVIKALLRSVTVYPYNEYVVLNTREIGKVVGIHPRNPLRPVVRVIHSADTGYLQAPKVIDLASISSLWITRAITADELPSER